MSDNAVHDLLTPEKLGELLVALPKCHEETARLAATTEQLQADLEQDRIERAVELKQINTTLEALLEQQGADNRTRERAGWLIKLGRGLATLALGGLLAGAGWFYDRDQEHTRVAATHAQRFVGIEDRVERHERSHGHEGTRGQVGDVQGDIREIRATLAAMRETLQAIERESRRRPR